MLPDLSPQGTGAARTTAPWIMSHITRTYAHYPVNTVLNRCRLKSTLALDSAEKNNNGQTRDRYVNWPCADSRNWSSTLASLIVKPKSIISAKYCFGWCRRPFPTRTYFRLIANDCSWIIVKDMLYKTVAHSSEGATTQLAECFFSHQGKRLCHHTVKHKSRPVKPTSAGTNIGRH